MYKSILKSLSLLKPQEKKKFLMLVLGRSLSGILDVLGVFLIGAIATLGALVVDPSSGGSKEVHFLGFKLPAPSLELIMYLVVSVLVIFIGKSILALLLSRNLAHHIANIETRNAKLLFSTILHEPLDRMKRYSKGEYQFVIGGSIEAAFGGLLNPLSTVIAETTLLFLVCIAFFFVNPLIALFAICYFAVLAYLIQLLVGRTARRAGAEAAEGAVGVSNTVSESVDAYKELFVTNKQELFIEKLNMARSRMAHSAATATFVSGLPRYIVETALILGIFGLVAQQFLTVGFAAGMVVLGVFMAGGMRIMASMLPLQTAFLSIKLASAQCEMAQLLLTNQNVDDITRSQEKTSTGPLSQCRPVAVRLTNVTYTHPGDSAPVIDSVTLGIEPGKFIAIIGPSGAGKTTLADLILGLLNSDSGEVSISAENKSDLPIQVAYVPQRPGLVAGSLLDNIALGQKDEDIDINRVHEAIKDAHLTEFVAELENGIHSSVGSQLSSLSGGQVQRIGLARALYLKPGLLVLDEATSALDAGSEAVVSQSIANLHGKVTVIVIAHRLSTVQHADNVFVLESGKLLAEGKLSDLIAEVPLVAEYVELMRIKDPAEN